MWIVSPLSQSKVETIFSDICCVAHTFCHRENFVFAPNALYIVYLLKVHCHSVFLRKLSCGHDCFSITLLESLGDFCCSPVHFAIGRICVCSTTPYIIHLLKVHCYYASLGKLYKRTVWVVHLSLY